MLKTSNVFCILGSARSGTSLTVKILKSLGVYFGKEEDLIGYDEEGTEHRRFREINASVLRRLGGSHDNPPIALKTVGWQTSADLDELRAKARELVDNEFGDAPKWGWKTPTTSLVLPFWQSILPEMNYILCVRNPLDVASSSKKFRNVVFPRSIYIWLVYTGLLAESTIHQRRFILLYEDFMQNWNTEIPRLLSFAGYDHPEKATEEKIDSLRRSDLWHHRSSLNDFYLSGQVPSPAKSLYVLLRALALIQGDAPAENGVDGSLEACVAAGKDEFFQKKHSWKNHRLRSLGSFISPVVPEAVKRNLRSLRDYLAWS